jgi:DHA1 family quinolone resistance protein-like MFS transporter
MSNSIKKLYYRYIAVNSSMALIFGLRLPIFYLMLIDKGFSLVEIGLLSSILGLSSLIFEVPFGILADRYGRKKIFILGEFFTIISVFGFWLSPTFSFMAISMFLNGISKSLISGSLDALFVHQYRSLGKEINDSFTRIQSMIFGFSSIALGIGTALGGLIPLLFENFSIQYDFIGFYDMNFIIMIIFILIHVVLTYFLINDDAIIRRTNSINEGSSYLAIFKLNMKSSLFILLLLLQFLNGMIFISVDNLWQPKLAEIINPKVEIWKFGFLSSLGFFSLSVGQMTSSKLKKIFSSNNRLLIFSQLILGSSLLFLSKSTNLYVFFFFYTLIFLQSGIAMSPLLTIFHKHIDERYRSMLLSLRNVFQFFGIMTGAFFGGWIAQNFDIGFVWYLNSFIILFSICLFFLKPLKNV